MDLFIAGSIHQGSESFSYISKGRQCSFMSFQRYSTQLRMCSLGAKEAAAVDSCFALVRAHQQIHTWMIENLGHGYLLMTRQWHKPFSLDSMSQVIFHAITTC